MRPQLVGTRPGHSAAAGAQRWLWSESGGSRQALLDALEVNVAALAQRWVDPESLLAEAQTRCKVSREAALGALNRLQSLDIVIGPHAWLAPESAAQPRLPEPLLLIRAWRRPQALARLLDSLHADAERWGVRRTIVVIDDDVDVSQSCVDCVREHALRSRNAIWYFGPLQRESSIDPLLAGFGGEQRAVVSRLLSTRGSDARNGGRTWNWSQLFGAGQALSMLDDDLAFPPCAMPERRQGIEVLNSIGCDTLFVDTDSDIAPPRLERDLYDYARDFVGQPARQLLAGDMLDLRSLAGSPVGALAYMEGDPQIVAAYGGVYGEIAWDSSLYLNAINPATAASLFKLPYRQERLIGNRVMQGVRQARLTAYAVYNPFLLDARKLMPFTGNFGKADDTLFLALVGAIEPQAGFAYLPTMIGHWPTEFRDRLAVSRQPLALDLNRFLADLAANTARSLRGADREQRLHALGKVLVDWTHCDDRTLHDEYAQWRRRSRAECAAMLDGVLRSHPDAPPQWRSHALQLLQVNQGAIATAGVGADEVDNLRGGLRQIAIGAQVWPEIWKQFAGLPLAERGAIQLNP